MLSLCHDLWVIDYESYIWVIIWKLLILGWVDTHHGVSTEEENTEQVQEAKVEEEDDDDEICDMEDFEDDDDLVIRKKYFLLRMTHLNKK